jgi:hypothetical protein
MMILNIYLPLSCCFRISIFLYPAASGFPSSSAAALGYLSYSCASKYSMSTIAVAPEEDKGYTVAEEDKRYYSTFNNYGLLEVILKPDNLFVGI